MTTGREQSWLEPPPPSASDPPAWLDLSRLPAGGWLGHACFALATAAGTYLGRLTRPEDSPFALAWPAAAVAVLWLAASWSSRSALVTAATGLVTVTAVTIGLSASPLQLCLALGGVSLAQAVTTCMVHHWLQPEGWYLGRPRDLAVLAVSAVVGAAVGGVLGPVALWLLDPVSPPLALTSAGLWAMRVSLSTVVLGVVALQLATWSRSRRFHPAGLPEHLLALSAPVLVAAIVLTGGSDEVLAVALAPLSVWVALRFSALFAGGYVLLVGGTLVTLTVTGRPPFPGGSSAEEVFLAQVLVAEMAAVTLSLALYRSEREDPTCQRLLARSAAENGRALLAAILETMADAVVVVDPDGSVLYRNPAARSLLARATPGACDGDPGGTGTSEHLPPELASVAQLGLPAAAPARRADVWVGGPDRDDARLVSVTALPLDDTAVRSGGTVLVCHDVTRQRQQETALLRALASERDAADRLAEIDRMKSQLVATISHELRTPLTNIAGYVDLLDDGSSGALTEEQSHLVSVVRRNAARLQRLVDDVRTVSEADAGTVRLSVAPLDLADTVRQACEDVLARSVGRRVVVTADVPAGRVPLLGDADQLRRAVSHLLTNGVNFTPDGGRVAVRMDRDGEQVVVEVSDTGVGMTAEDHARMLDSFERSREAHATAVQGAGLGLSVARVIAEGHGGRLRIDSLTGEGTRATITLPLGSDDAAGPTTAAADATHAVGAIDSMDADPARSAGRATTLEEAT